MKLKKGDQVIVKSGNYKGKKGKIERVFPKEKKILIPGVNVKKKHVKRKDEKHPGGIIDVAKPIFASQVLLLCPFCHQKTRVGYKIMGKKKKKKKRFCKKCNQELDK